MITSESSNFMWQLFFYVLKYLHIPLLLGVFVFGMFYIEQDLNLFYIGILYYFIKFVSSLSNYRKSGFTLIVYACFFICFQYIDKLFDKILHSESDDNLIIIIQKIINITSLENNSTADEKESISKAFKNTISLWIILGVFLSMY